MARNLSLVVVALCFAACGGGDGGAEVPSCQQAVTHYYNAGCAFIDLDTGDPIPANQIVGVCQEILATAPASCDDEIDDFLFCLDSVPSPASSNAQCDCTREQDALLTCG